MNCRLVRVKKAATSLPQIWKQLFDQRFPKKLIMNLEGVRITVLVPCYYEDN